VVQPSDTRPDTDVRVVDAILAALAPFEAQGFRFHLAGDAAENYLGGVDLASGNARLVPFAVLVMGAMLFALSRSLAQTLAVLATMGVAVVWTFGLLGWLGWPRDGILEVLAALLLVVGVCDSMHLLASLESAAGPLPERLCASARDVGGACAFATLTDAAAFASFATSSLDTFVRFGAISAFGVLATLLLTFTLLPLAIARGADAKARSGGASRAWSAALGLIAPLAERRRHAILAVSAVALAGFGFCWWTLLQVDTDWLETWGERNERTRSIRLIQDRLGSAKTLELKLAAPSGASETPDGLALVQQLERELERLEPVSGTRSVVDLIARMNRLVHGDDAAYERAPATPAAAAELLELLSLDDESVLAPWVSVDRSQFRVSVETHELPYQTGRAFVADVRAACRRVLPPGWEIALTGEIPMTVDWVEDVQATQLRGFPTAVLTVYLLIAAFLRSFPLALGALLPTLIPIVVTLGSMGLLGLDLDVGRAMIGSVVIGIGVDDAIHLASQYRARRGEGSPPRAALAQAIEHSGRAIVTNSLTLALGFLTLMVSPWQSISSFGFFAALTIVGALVSTLLVMPALILAFQREPSP
jgi:predicted RND superfamily exporter protein